MFPENEITKDMERAKRYFEDIVSFSIGPYSLDELISKRVNEINIVDVREYENYIKGHIPFAQHLPYDDIKNNVGILDKSKVTVIYTYSDSCPRAYNTAITLLKHDFPSIVLRGGFKQWKKFDFDIVKTESEEK